MENESLEIILDNKYSDEWNKRLFICVCVLVSRKRCHNMFARRGDGTGLQGWVAGLAASKWRVNRRVKQVGSGEGGGARRSNVQRVKLVIYWEEIWIFREKRIKIWGARYRTSYRHDSTWQMGMSLTGKSEIDQNWMKVCMVLWKKAWFIEVSLNHPFCHSFSIQFWL